MPARPSVSVCIPSYKRPQALGQALQSIIDQDCAPTEILVSDDSPDAASEPIVERARTAAAFPIRYERHEQRLGQNANVNKLFRDASGDFLILLHDDDLLSPGAIRSLMAPVLNDRRVRVVFGLQRVISADGAYLPEVTRERNASRRLDRPSVAKDSPLEAGLLQQFPNDSYLIESRLAREIGYRSKEEIDVFGDLDFGIRVGHALGPGEMAFVDEVIADYRLSPDAISINPKTQKRDRPIATTELYRSLAALNVPPASEYARQHLLLAYILHMVRGFALQRQRRTALRLFLSATYGWRRRLSPKGAYHLALILAPEIDRLRPY